MKNTLKVLGFLSLMSWFILLTYACHLLRHFVRMLIDSDQTINDFHMIIIIIACLVIIVGSVLSILRLIKLKNKYVNK